jgi:hypothetical protein
MDDSFRLRLDGLDASHHHISMQHLGHVLVGANKIMVAGLIVAAFCRVPKRGERFDLQIVAEAPKQSSVEIVGILKQIPWVLPLVHEFIARGGSELTSRFLSYVLARFGGRPSEAHVNLEAFVQLSRAHLAARNESEERFVDLVKSVVDRLPHPARQVVSPIGRGAAELLIGSGRSPRFITVDEPMADVIRSQQPDEVGDLQSMRLKVDGIIHHSRQLKVVHPLKEGQFITAEVRDPNFDSTPNLYSEAAANLYEIDVQAKPVFRNSELHKLYIMDATKSG